MLYNFTYRVINVTFCFLDVLAFSGIYSYSFLIDLSSLIIFLPKNKSPLDLRTIMLTRRAAFFPGYI